MKREKSKIKLLREVLTTSVVIILVISYVSYALINRKQEEKSRAKNILLNILELENHGLNTWYSDRKNHIEDITKHPQVIKFTKELLALKKANISLKDHPIQQEIRNFFHPILDKHNYLGIFILSPDYYSLTSMRDENLGTINFLSKKKKSQIQKAFNGNTSLITPLKSDVHLTGDANKPTMFIASPIKDENNKVIAVFTFRLDPDRSLSTYTAMSSYGKTSQTYAFDQAGRVVTGRKLHELFNGKSTPSNPDTSELTLASLNALKGNNGYNVDGYKDYSGNEVYGAWLWNNNLNLGLVSEISKKEAMTYYRQYQSSLYIAAVVIIILTILLTVLIYINRSTKENLYNKLKDQMNNLETSLGLFVSNAPVGIAINDKEGNFVEINHEFSRFTGYTVDELNELSYWDITPSEYEEEEKKQLELLSKTGKYGPYEKQYLHKNGHRFDVLLSGVKVKNNQGEEFIWSIVQDLSESKKKENEIKVQEERYRTLVSNLPGAVFRCNFDSDYTMLFISDFVEQITGYPSNDFINNKIRSFASIIHPDDIAYVETQINLSIEKNTTYAIQYRLIDANQNIRWVHESGVVVKNEDNLPSYIDGFFKDITDRVLAEKNFKTNKERFDLAIKAGRLGVWECNLSNKQYIWDDSMYDLFQIEEKEGKKPIEILKSSIHHEDIEEVLQKIEKAINNGRSLDIAYRIIDHDGQQRYHLSKGNFIYNSNNEAIRMIGINVDITNEMEAKLDLKKSHKDLESFAYVASHDLQEPLRVITSYLQIIEAKYANNLEDRGKQLMQRIVAASDRMKRLINDLLDYSRVNRKGENFKQTDLNEVLKTAIEDSGVLIQENKAFIESDDLPTIPCDQTQMHQVFMNLLNNGIKYHKEDTKPKIKITSKKIKDNHIEISFADNGIGIKPEFHDRIFEIFQRLHTREEYQGTGLGLAITKKIIERHEGSIVVESQLNEGAIFKITLPLN